VGRNGLLFSVWHGVKRLSTGQNVAEFDSD
jgi:hypothetical protein